MKIFLNKKSMKLLIPIAILFTIFGLQAVYSAYNLTADDFFISLIENKADLTEGVAMFELKNPTSITINANPDTLKTRMENQTSAKPLSSLEYFVLKNVSYSQNLTNYS